MKESKFQPGDLVSHASTSGLAGCEFRGTLLLVELSTDAEARLSTGRTSDFDYTWHALGPRGMLLVWESNLTLISRGQTLAELKELEAQ